ncbi:S-DNA-T family DNA segregation ATPase FtsK/SpoIIIE [Candidatus Kinetoplastibacterium desouzaii TCC079E]|uniref:S-DNA-T family DNA segregation ATPase FtsK/SpoIIIE n=1 Tax=Candidatus Kinetoplastidibacterium desouzai TCC079E TaxID=1208919 RepID=M1LMW7_9PROT|nr:DNA translocase FtsK [Candidatus Kinetoplastibacterium desouzaii]AGF47067.1 S-DNA-T family DNA segregation ATPase FtsK/SpoIIIE [Candidatus Kinetoplastibacterium desouzaii TCC079E]
MSQQYKIFQNILKFRNKLKNIFQSIKLSTISCEAIFILFILISIWVTVSLVTWNFDDRLNFQGYSLDAKLQNKGGVLGFYISDFFITFLGFSSWWFIFLMFSWVFVFYRYLDSRLNNYDSKNISIWNSIYLERIIGFIFVLLGSSGIESLYIGFFYQYLPIRFSNICSLNCLIGSMMVDFLYFYLGYIVTNLIFLAMLFIGVGLFFSFSWLSFFEYFGSLLNRLFSCMLNFCNYIRRLVFSVINFVVRVIKNLINGFIKSKVLDKKDNTSNRTSFIKKDSSFDKKKLMNISNRNNDVDNNSYSSSENFYLNSDNDSDLNDNDSDLNDEIIDNKEDNIGFYDKNNKESIAHDNQITTINPDLSLLDPPKENQFYVTPEIIESTSRLIERKLSDFGVVVKVVLAESGPVVTRYEIEPDIGVKGSQIVNLARDLARALSVASIRVVETIPGKNLMGLELPNKKRQSVNLSEILNSEVYLNSSSVLTMALGKDIAGNPIIADLAKMPHLLVAGTTGSGKSVGINAMIISLLYKSDPSQIRLILIDPKMLEMSIYEGIPHLLTNVVTDMKKASNALRWCVGEMERRYKIMSKLGVRNLAGYNEKIIEASISHNMIKNPFSISDDNPEFLQRMPAIVVVIDELADLMMVVGKKIEELIARLAQKARAAGIHLILATQRPSVDVITGLIKANIPTRIAFQVSSKIDSRTILDQSGAENLLGQGDMLYLPPGVGFPVRVHGAFVSDDEVHRVVDHFKSQGEANYIEGILDSESSDSSENINSITGIETHDDDPMYDKACEIVIKHKRASISLVQRHLRIGYNRAARLLEQMEKEGMVSKMSSNGNREILIALNNDDV